MKLMSLPLLINHAFRYVIDHSVKYNIDESHALKHSMEVFHYTNKIYKSEVVKHPYLKEQQDIIYASAILHDMCDKKYMLESDGILQIQNFMRCRMSDYITEEKISTISEIIGTMSYSKVKVNGFPKLDNFQRAYHIVREADLLCAYDVDRCVIYAMMCEHMNYQDSLKRAVDLFENRVLKYRADNLFITNYSKNASLKLHMTAVREIHHIKENIDLMY